MKEKDVLSEYSWLIFSGDDPLAERKRRRKVCAAVCAGIVLLFAASCAVLSLLPGDAPSGKAESLARGAASRDEALKLRLTYRGLELEKDVSLTVLSQHIDAAMAEQLFDECEVWIRAELKEGISFPDEAPNGVSISWQNADFSYIGAERGSTVKLITQLGAGEFCRVTEFAVRMDPTEEDILASLDSLGEDLADELGRDDLSPVLQLPGEAEGVALEWSYPKEQSPLLLLPLALFAAAFVWLSKDDPEKKEIKRRKARFEQDIPGMSFQLMLLLNAGLIAESAFSQLIEQSASSKRPLYRALRDISGRAKARNMPFISELYLYAKQTKSAAFMRFATLVYEHVGRGSSLADKLEQERNMMLSSRLSSAKAKAREAETRLCFPLILLLIALIIITAVPSFMTM